MTEKELQEIRRILRFFRYLDYSGWSNKYNGRWKKYPALYPHIEGQDSDMHTKKYRKFLAKYIYR